MPWYSFTRPNDEALGIADSIRANYVQFLQRPDWPEATAAAFLRFDSRSGATHFYLSPDFVKSEPFMADLYRAHVCPQPARGVGLALLVGQFGAMQLLK